MGRSLGMRLHNKKKRTYPAIKQEQRLTVEKFGGPTLVLFPHLTRCYNFQGRGVPGKGECECLTLASSLNETLVEANPIIISPTTPSCLDRESCTAVFCPLPCPHSIPCGCYKFQYHSGDESARYEKHSLLQDYHLMS